MSIRTPEWVKDAVFYQVFPDRFARSGRQNLNLHLQAWGEAPTFHDYMGGDLWGVIERLDHIQSLGVNALYFCPVFQSASNHRYHTHDYFKVDPMLGGDEALRALIDAAHARGMKVVLDGVFNHASRGFFQFNDLLEQGEHSAYRDWFHVQDWPLYPYEHQHPANYAAWWGNRALPKFNTANPSVREFLWSVAEHWINLGVDGWRLDVPNEIDDDSFWQAFRRRVKAINPEAYIVGEIWGDAGRWLSGDQFDAVMNYNFTRPCLAYFGVHSLDNAVNRVSGIGTLEPLDAAAFAQRVTELAQAYDPQIVQAQLNLLGSHDTARFLTAVRGDASAFRLATIFQMTYPGAPCIYYGDEIGLPGGPDPDCRRAFPWDQPEIWDRQMLHLIQSLSAARHASRALRRGDFTVLHADGDLLAYRREDTSGRAYVLMNTGHDARDLSLSGLTPGHYQDALSGHRYVVGDSQTFSVPGRGALVLTGV